MFSFAFALHSTPSILTLPIWLGEIEVVNKTVFPIKESTLVAIVGELSFFFNSGLNSIIETIEIKANIATWMAIKLSCVNKLTINAPKAPIANQKLVNSVVEISTITARIITTIQT